MTAARAAAVTSLVLFAGACMIGPTVWNYPVATRPAGATVAVRVTGETSDRVGELLASDSGGVVVRGPRLARIPWRSLAAMDVADQGARYDVRWGERVGEAKWRRLALLSRFPSGLQGEVLRRVLAGAGQDSLDVVP